MRNKRSNNIFYIVLSVVFLFHASSIAACFYFCFQHKENGSYVMDWHETDDKVGDVFLANENGAICHINSSLVLMSRINGLARVLEQNNDADTMYTRPVTVVMKCLLLLMEEKKLPFLNPLPFYLFLVGKFSLLNDFDPRKWGNPQDFVHNVLFEIIKENTQEAIENDELMHNLTTDLELLNDYRFNDIVRFIAGKMFLCGEIDLLVNKRNETLQGKFFYRPGITITSYDVNQGLLSCNKSPDNLFGINDICLRNFPEFLFIFFSPYVADKDVKIQQENIRRIGSFSYIKDRIVKLFECEYELIGAVFSADQLYDQFQTHFCPYFKDDDGKHWIVHQLSGKYKCNEFEKCSKHGVSSGSSLIPAMLLYRKKEPSKKEKD